MPGDPIHPAMLDIEALLKNCEVKQTRASGPGGQHRNKVETAIVISHLPSGVIGQASERRSQNDNREKAIHRLRINLALSVRSIRDSSDPTPSQRWLARLNNGRILVNRQHAEYPALLAEALDVLHCNAWDVPQASKVLGCTSSQLVKFLKKEPEALSLLNRNRKELGLLGYR